MFKGIDFRNFLDTPEEWHALAIGFGYGYCPWVPAFPMSAQLKKEVIKEHHYFVIGTAVGLAGFMFTIAGAVAYVLGRIL